MWQVDPIVVVEVISFSKLRRLFILESYRVQVVDVPIFLSSCHWAHWFFVCSCHGCRSDYDWWASNIGDHIVPGNMHAGMAILDICTGETLKIRWNEIDFCLHTTILRWRNKGFIRSVWVQLFIIIYIYICTYIDNKFKQTITRGKSIITLPENQAWSQKSFIWPDTFRLCSSAVYSRLEQWRTTNSTTI